MRAKIEINEALIKVALMRYFGKYEPSKVTLNVSPNIDDRYGQTLGYSISGEVEVNIDDIISQ